MGLTKSSFKKHDHGAFTSTECEEHNGVVSIFTKCSFKCVKHFCNGKEWIEENEK